MLPDATDPTARVAVAFDVAVDATELLADRLFTAGASAVAEMPGPDGLVTLIADLDLAGFDLFTRRSGDAGVDAGTDGGTEGEFAGEGEGEVEGGGAASAAPTPRPRLLEPEIVWNHGWREFARAWQCGDRVVLRPEWVNTPAQPSPGVTIFDATESDASDTGASDAGAADTDAGSTDQDGPGSIEVLIEPGGAFGSGSHITTRLCAALLDGLVHGGDRVLDVGCGTGVLGVAAALLGAGSVTAVDIDPEAVRVTQLVAERNGVRHRVAASDTPLARVDGVFDLVLANLLLPIICELGADLADRVAPGGRLIASGVLLEQQAHVASALAPLTLDRVTAADGWVAMVFRSPCVR